MHPVCVVWRAPPSPRALAQRAHALLLCRTPSPPSPFAADWNFTPSAFSRAAIPPATFAVPPGCDAMCKTTGEAYTERLAARAVTASRGGA
jgi:hypothetical protein